MASFAAQFAALCRKNWIVLWRHRWINLVRCLILPIAYAAFFAKAQDFFTTRGVYGPGKPQALPTLPADLLGLKLVYSPPPNVADFTLLDDALSRAGVSGRVARVPTPEDVEAQCPENFNLLSECFAAVSFSAVDTKSATLNYTLRGDFGLAVVDVENINKDDQSARFAALQWAIESTFIEAVTGTAPDPPRAWAYTTQTREEHDDELRLSYLRGVRELLGLAWFIGFLGIVYHLPGSVASERASLLTAHLDAMGCRKRARILSWHLSISAAYIIAWICTAVIYQQFILKRTNAGLVIVLYALAGMSMGSWTFLVASPFANAPTLAAIAATFFAILFAIMGQIIGSRAGTQLIFALIFPPSFLIFVNKGMASWELAGQGANIVRRSPDGDAPIIALMVIAIIVLFLYPSLAVLVERRLYGIPSPDGKRRGLSRFFRKKPPAAPAVDDGVAVQLSHISKTYISRKWGLFGRKRKVVAIEDLSLAIPRNEIYCLLGRNGAAKSTTLSSIGRLTRISGGTISYAPGLSVGIASQRDVLWDELTCMQHVRLWRAIKSQGTGDEADDALLARCDLAPKVSFLSKNLSGGQKRKLMLACALAGGSNLLLLDEISSGLDPLSRRAIWKLVTANRGHATIVLTTHFLDEADYLGDTVAILRQPGRVLAIDNPVALKTRLGRGLTLALEDDGDAKETARFLSLLRQDIPDASIQATKGRVLVHTGTNDIGFVRGLVRRLDVEGARFQVGSTTLEEVFLDLNADVDPDDAPNMTGASPTSSNAATVDGTRRVESSESSRDHENETTKEIDEKDMKVVSKEASQMTETDVEAAQPVLTRGEDLALTPGTHPSWLRATARGASTIFRKRIMILRQGWLLPVVTIVIVICAAAIPLRFMKDRQQSCEVVTKTKRMINLSLPRSAMSWMYGLPIASAGSAAQVLGDWLSRTGVRQLPADASFVDTVISEIRNLTYGGVSLARLPSADQIVAYEAEPLTLKGLSMLNLFSNSVLEQLRPSPTGVSPQNLFRINLDFQWIPAPSFASTGLVFKWVGFYALGVAIWPAFATVYPTVERASNVRANQYSNGASPVALWLGHILFELPSIVFISTVLTIIFAVASSQFNAPGILWVCFVLYGISATLYAYLFALFLRSPLASFAAVAGTNVVLALLYLSMYLLILTYDRSSAAPQHQTIGHYTMALINPVPNIVRATLVSVNVFSLLCDGLGNRTSKPYSDINQFGGPILYMILQMFFAFGILVWVDSGAPIPSFLRFSKNKHIASSGTASEDVAEEAQRVTQASDALVVRGLSKKFRGNPIPSVDNVSFGVDNGETFALIGPNGAGKTTTLACIRGVEPPTRGDVFVTSHSIVQRRNDARASLGVCPQVNAIDPNLTVRQHLWVYGRLKGVPRGMLGRDVDALLAAAGLAPKADDLATSLSGGNQRKLALAIALIGDRPVVLIDEFSSGVDPFSKREAWATLAALTRDRAVVMTTHSMEEVDALASRVGIIASKMLAVGTPGSLKSRFATYEIHLSDEHVDETLKYLHGGGFDTARPSHDSKTRVSIPDVREDRLDALLGLMERVQAELGLSHMALHEASTETAFLSIVNEHNVQEDTGHVTQSRKWLCFGRKK